MHYFTEPHIHKVASHYTAIIVGTLRVLPFCLFLVCSIRAHNSKTKMQREAGKWCKRCPTKSNKHAHFGSECQRSEFGSRLCSATGSWPHMSALVLLYNQKTIWGLWYHHHHPQARAPSWSVAVSTRCFQCSRSWAYFQAELRPRL